MITIDDIASYWALGMSIAGLAWAASYVYCVARRALAATVEQHE